MMSWLPSHILASFQMHIESLQRSTSHRTTTYFVHRFIWALRRLVSPWGQLSTRLHVITSELSQRKKWMYFFESVTSILFCASLQDYNRQGEPGEESLAFISPWCTWRQIADSINQIFCIFWISCQFAVVFADVDHTILDRNRRAQGQTTQGTYNMIHVLGFYLFRQVPLERYVPQYPGGDINKAVKHILLHFMQFHRARLNVYPQ